MNVVLISIGCGLLAVLYGLITIMQVLKSPAGSERMQDIASAVQEGARAYLARQYMTIAIVGVIVAALVGYFLGIVSAVGFVIGARLLQGRGSAARVEYRLRYYAGDRDGAYTDDGFFVGYSFFLNNSADR